jgi:hypothetical protein
MTATDGAFEAARAAYGRDPTYAHCVAWYHALRAARRVDEMIDLVMTWRDRVADPIQTGQIGVFCNDVGEFAAAEACLTRSLPGLGDPRDRYLAMMEMVTAKALQGDHQGAHRLQRSLRTRAEWEAVSLRVGVVGGDISAYAEYLEHLLENDTSPEGKRVVVLQEGGFGDQIWFFRYVRDLMAEGAISVCWPTVPGLAACFEASQPGVVSGRGYAYDLGLRTCSLVARYQGHPYFPSHEAPYLHGLGGRARAELPVRRPGDRPRIGLIWRSESRPRHEPFRSMDLADLAPILAREGLGFESLQVGPMSESEGDILDRHGVVRRGETLNDFGDTAALFAEIDLLITIDTAAAHLAGALGLPVWVLLSKACDFRWGDQRRFTPWYRSMRLYRQDKLGDWSGPLAAMSADLAGI